MLTLNGKLLSVLNYDERTAKDGTVYPARMQVQVQTEEALEDGQVKIGLHSITVPTGTTIPAKIGQTINLPVRAYASGRDVKFVYNPPISSAVAAA